MTTPLTGGLLSAGILASLLAGCTVHQKRDPKDLPVDLPTEFAAAEQVDRVTAPDEWWTAFGDAELNRLEQQMVKGSLDLKQAWARMKQAEALAKQAKSANLPEITLSASASRNRSANPVLGSFSNNAYNISAAAAYEVDVWGRVADQVAAAKLEVKASRLDAEAVAMTLAAQVAETWFSLVEQRAQQTLLTEQIKTNETLLELVEARFAQGLASAVDVFQQRQNVISVKARIPQVEGQIKVLEHTLAVLVGEAPGQTQPGERAELPEELPPVPSVGVPADLIKRRPDVESVRLRVQATDHRVGAAIADRFPALRLSPSTGFTAFNLSELLDNWVYSLAASVGASVFDGGRRAAVVEQQKAALDQQLAALASQMLTALREVEDALVLERQQQAFLEELTEQHRVAEQLLTETQARYAEGLSDFLPVLGAVQSVQGTESALLQARRQLISHRISLYRALGGRWTSKLKAPEKKAASARKKNQKASQGGEQAATREDGA